MLLIIIKLKLYLNIFNNFRISKIENLDAELFERSGGGNCEAISDGA
jgi:NADPH-dependent 7-cyano-7-deazaguanine reductase QueF-like protein